MLFAQAKAAADVIAGRIAEMPKIGIILGSGLGQLADEIEDAVIIPYEEIPHFRTSTAPGHQGRLVIGKLGGKQVLCMQGRLHLYEGYSLKEATFPVRVMSVLGIESLLISNASGGINTSFAVGDLMVLTDHINMMGTNPLIGPNEADFGLRFSDMTYAYAPALQAVAHEAAGQLGQSLRQGVYVATMGPNYETPAEIRMYRGFGADAVGMSTVPEVLVANHCGLKVLAISCITNMAAGILDQPLTEEEVLETGAMAGGRFRALVEKIVEMI